MIPNETSDLMQRSPRDMFLVRMEQEIRATADALANVRLNVIRMVSRERDIALWSEGRVVVDEGLAVIQALERLANNISYVKK